MKPKKDAVLPGLRVTAEFAERAYRAMDILGSDLSEVRRKLWEDYIRIAENGESLSSPPRLMTASEDRVSKTFLEWGPNFALSKFCTDISRLASCA